MSNNGLDWADRLVTFRLYLKTVEKVVDSTADGYVKRILAICREENLSLDTLAENIKDVYFEYSAGAKRELGMRSHNSYRAALKHFCRFVTEYHGKLDKSNPASASPTPTCRIEIRRVPNERFGVIRLFDKAGKLLDTSVTLSRESHSADEITQDLAMKSLIMVLQNVYKNDSAKIFEILRNAGVSLSIDGKEFF